MGWFIFAVIMLVTSVVSFIWFIRVRSSLAKARNDFQEADKAYRDADDYATRRDLDQKLREVKEEREYYRLKAMFLGVAAGIAFLIGGITLATDTVVQVPARNVGVVNEFGNTTDTLSNGLHVVAPWATVEDVDTTNKPIQLTDDGNVDNGCTSIAVRLATQTTACQDVFVQWQIDPKGDAKDLWKNYRGSNDDLIANIQNNVILPRLRSEMQKSFSTYDPLSVLQGGKLQDTTTLQEPVKAVLTGDMPDGVLLLDVRFGQIHYDSATQGKINAYSQAVADTKITQQKEQTATAQAQANKELAKDPSTNNPGVEYQNCLNMVSDLAAKNQLQYLPQGFTCSQNGAGVGIIVGNK